MTGSSSSPSAAQAPRDGSNGAVPAFHIRPFRRDDRAQVVRVLHCTMGEFGDADRIVEALLKQDLGDIVASYMTPARSIFLCAIAGPQPTLSPDAAPSSDELVIGTVGLRPLSVADPAYYRECQSSPLNPAGQPIPFEPDNTLELNRMAVLPSFRRRGVATALLAACVGFARSVGASGLHLRTMLSRGVGRSMYRARGFVEYRRDRYCSKDWLGMGSQAQRVSFTLHGQPGEDVPRLHLSEAEVPSGDELLEQAERGVVYTGYFILRIPRADKSSSNTA